MKKSLLFVIFLLALNISYSAEEAKDSLNQKILLQAQKFLTMLQTMHKYSSDSIDVIKASDEAMKYMLTKNDPGAFYYTADERKAFNEKDKGQRISIGLKVIRYFDTLTVSSIDEFSPAKEAGIMIGDKIMAIDTINAIKMSSNKAQELFKGDPGESIGLSVKRGYTGEMRIYTLERKLYGLSSIDAHFYVKENKSAYISISRFSRKSDTEFDSLASMYKDKGAEYIILDLRNNMGGFLASATNIIDMFIDEEKLITYTESKLKDYSVEYKSTANAQFKGIPLLVLINGQSASASEALAGAVQDMDLGLILGKRSYGKGSAQKFWQMKDSSAFKLTIAKYYTPSGRIIHRDRSKESKLQANLPIHKSESGRIIIGGGGIIPDRIIEDDTLCIVTNKMLRSGLIKYLAFDILNLRREEIKAYEDIYAFEKNFKINNKELDKFVSLAKANKMWRESDFDKDMEYIILRTKAEIANVIWGHFAFKYILKNWDKVLDASFKNLEQAKKIIIK